MNIVLKQSGENVGVYIDKNLTTIFENQDINFVSKWILKNWTNTKITVI